MRRPLLAAALAAVAVLAGCAGPLAGSTATPTPAPPSPAPSTTPATATATATPAPTATPTPEPPVDVKYGETGVNATLVFERVERLTGEDIAQPTVYVQDDIVLSSRNATVYRVLGLTDQRFPADRSTGVTRQDGSVTFDPAGDRVDVERTLAHEYVHVVQFQSGMVPLPGEYVEGEVTSDAAAAWQMVLEGGAVFVTDAYVRAHMDARPQSAVMADLYEDPPTPASRLTLAWYTFGYEYVDARVDDPANLSAAYDRMPTTTEQVLHHERRPREQPMAVTVDERVGGGWDQVGDGDRKGELFVRVLLRTELDRERAARAAAGWGTDRWLLYTDGDDDDGDGRTDADGAAWVLRWDTAADADEFEAAARAYGQRRDESVGDVRVRRLDDDTVALLVGTEPFLRNASVGVENGTVTVDVGGEGAAAPRPVPDRGGAGGHASSRAAWLGRTGPPAQHAAQEGPRR